MTMELLKELWTEQLILRMCVILIPILLFIIWGFLHLFKSQVDILNEYERVKKLVEDAETKEELKVAWDEAVKWSKLCWHRSHSTLTIEIKTMLKTKQKYL